MRVVADLSTRVVGLVLARARDRELNQQSRQRSQDDEQKDSDYAQRILVFFVATAAEEQAELADLGQQGDCAGQDRHNRAAQNVPVADMGELVRQHPIDLFLVEELQQALIHTDRGVVRVAAGGERV